MHHCIILRWLNLKYLVTHSWWMRYVWEKKLWARAEWERWESDVHVVQLQHLCMSCMSCMTQWDTLRYLIWDSLPSLCRWARLRKAAPCRSCTGMWPFVNWVAHRYCTEQINPQGSGGIECPELIQDCTICHYMVLQAAWSKVWSQIRRF